VQCPHCRTELEESALTCPNCEAGVSIQLANQGGQAFGPYSVEAVSCFMREGRITPSSFAKIGPGRWTPLRHALASLGVDVEALAPSTPQPAAAPADAQRRSGRAPALAVVAACGGVLLVVVLLLCVVAAPSVLRNRAKHQRHECKDHVWQLGLALRMYSQDWDERFPPYAGWQDKLLPYTENQGTFNCPTTKLSR